MNTPSPKPTDDKPQIAPCPICGHRCALDFDGGHGEGLPFPKGYGAVRCLKVPQHYQGPTVESHAEAIRLHNALCAPALAPFEKDRLDKFVNISDVVVKGEPDACKVTFDVGSQHFDVTGVYFENKEEAEWMRSMFLKALSAVVEEVRGK